MNLMPRNNDEIIKTAHLKKIWKEKFESKFSNVIFEKSGFS